MKIGVIDMKLEVDGVRGVVKEVITFKIKAEWKKLEHKKTPTLPQN